MAIMIVSNIGIERRRYYYYEIYSINDYYLFRIALRNNVSHLLPNRYYQMNIKNIEPHIENISHQLIRLAKHDPETAKELLKGLLNIVIVLSPVAETVGMAIGRPDIAVAAKIAGKVADNIDDKIK